jgi:UDP-N-acetylmuramate: L-alanyl-gamma-D-glutamyl-meso-diaminopimelate ligase
MHLHILGICGTFMGGLALIARAAGHRVTGCDANVYPPMSTQLQAQGIELLEGFGEDQLQLRPDVWVVGNVITRGNPLMEAILDRSERYVSGPQWLAEVVLHGRWVLAVAGTHGKTTTSAMLAWILERAGQRPGFLIGGVPDDFGVSARLTERPCFVIEADEYDTAFFDKRSKFLHYRARTAVINNIEFDHADIFQDLAAIETQFHHFVRTLPSRGLLLAPSADAVVERVLTRGCWTRVETFGAGGDWSSSEVTDTGFTVRLNGADVGRLDWHMLGAHNRCNALAAIAAARDAGVQPQAAIDALASFRGVKRRMERRGEANGVVVYDDFAHHPTAIATTLQGLRSRLGAQRRIIAVLEPRSNTMKLGVMKERLAGSLRDADRVFCYTQGLAWDARPALAALGDAAHCEDRLERLVQAIAAEARPGDTIVVMSNGGFGGIHDKLLAALSARP